MFEDLSTPSMGAGSDLLLFLNCSDCGLLGPPPSAILTLPPPPLPSFLQRTPLDELLQMGVTDNRTAGAVAAEAAAQAAAGVAPDSAGPCGQMCEWNSKPGVEFIELPRQVGTMVDDTWFLVLISCCAGVLLLGGILAVIMLRCRSSGSGKTGLGIDPSALAHHKPSKAAGGCEVLYPTVSAPASGDPRALWAALTPSGATHHFVTPRPAPAPAPVPVSVPPATHFQLTQRHLSGSAAPPTPTPTPPAEPEYAMPMCAGPPPSEPPPPPPVMVAAFTPSPHTMKTATKTTRNSAATLPQRTRADSAASFDNSGFIDSDDAAYEMAREDLMAMSPYMTSTMSMSSRNMGMASGGRTWRPRVSSPTRIEHPNMPPLNMHPAAAYLGTGRRSVRRSPRRGSDSAAAPPAL